MDNTNMELESAPRTSFPKSPVGTLLQALSVMVKKPQVESDLSGVLDGYLKILDESDLFLSNGIFTINFAEAALLLQDAVVVFSKKVDLLWDQTMNYHKRMLTYDRKDDDNKQEASKLEERIQKYKRKRKIVEQPKEASSSDIADIDKFLAEMNSINISKDQVSNENNEEAIKYLSDICNKYVGTVCHKKSTFEYYKRHFYINLSFDVYENNEILFNNNQLLSKDFYLIGDDFRKVQFSVSGRRDMDVVGIDVRDNLLQKFILANNVTDQETLLESCQGAEKFIKTYIETHTRKPPNLQEQCKKLCPRRSSILITRLSSDVLNKYLTKDEENVVEKREKSLEKTASLLSLAEKTGSTTKDSSAELSTLSQPQDNSAENLVASQASVADSGFCESTLNSSQETNCTDSPGNETNITDLVDRDVEESFSGNTKLTTSTPKTGQLDLTLQSDTRTPRSMTKRKLKDEFDDEPPKKKERKKVFRMLKTTTAMLKAFEIFHFNNYKPEENEGTVIEPEFPNSEDETMADSTMESVHNVGDLQPLPAEDSNVGEININLASETTAHVENSQIDNSTSQQPCSQTTEAANSSTTATETEQTPNDTSNSSKSGTNFKTTTFDRLKALMKERQASQERYMEWKAFITNKLARTTHKEFDIHEYGTKVLDKLPEKEPAKFASLVRGQSSAEVVRFFIASLQLANTYNVEVTNARPGQLANETFELKLLSRERHHEALNEYQAPSEEGLQEKLDRVRVLSNQKVCDPNIMMFYGKRCRTKKTRTCKRPKVD